MLVGVRPNKMRFELRRDWASVRALLQERAPNLLTPMSQWAAPGWLPSTDAELRTMYNVAPCTSEYSLCVQRSSVLPPSPVASGLHPVLYVLCRGTGTWFVLPLYRCGVDAGLLPLLPPGTATAIDPDAPCDVPSCTACCHSTGGVSG